ncbi:histidine phosphatase family protein [Leptolyngbya sp. KIOST-1]|uniref:histidine phosphatase family protein n=1 Tax=Leptolyngbya sp. KIOST-1 TaxID=1229172 RepID=UPI0006924F40|nr:histidine phosphatase family protein [Leptolyngbya sp. KIOST-1]
MTPLKLLLVRHGQSVGNAAGRMEGISSTGLTALGRQQSQRLGQELAATGWHPTHIYSSPLRRATETLTALGQGLGIPTPALHAKPSEGSAESGLFDSVNLIAKAGVAVDISPELSEYDAGLFNGLTWAEACDRYPDLCQQLETSLDWQPIPGAETPEQGRARAQRFLAQVLARHGNGDRILVISHHWLLQQLIAGLLGSDRAWGLAMGHTARFEFWLDRDRWEQPGVNRLNTELWQIKRFNDCTHCLETEFQN